MRKLFSVTILTGFLTLLKMLCGFFVSKVVAVYAGPTGVAMLGQLQSLTVSLNGIINAAVNTPVVRYTAENDSMESRSEWWKASLFWMMLIAVATALIGIALSGRISDFIFSDVKLGWLITASCIFLPLAGIGTFLNSVINGLEFYKKYIARGMLSVVISSLFIVIMVVYYGINGALLAVGIQYALVGTVFLLLSIREPWFRLTLFFGRVDKNKFRKIGEYILMAVISAIAVPLSMIIIRNDIISNLGWDSAGNWQAVRKISDVYLSVITTALSVYFLPKLSRLKSVDAILSEINKTLMFILPVAIILALAIYMLRDVIITVLFTDDFKTARDLFLFQLIGDVIKAVSWIYAYPMLSRGATKWFIFSEVFFSITFVALVHVCLAFVGLEGVNIAYLINYFFYFLFVFFNVKRFSA